MAMITWDDKYSVGVSEIDAQHKQLISMINRLHDAMLAGKSKEILGGILNGLIDYTGSHFKTEEVFFDKFAYPGTLYHVKEHRDFVSTVTNFKTKYDAGSASFSIELMTFLSDWLKKHISVSDKKYGPFLNAKGVV